MRKLLAVVAAALSAVILISCGGGQEEKKPLLVGMELQYPPFEMTDKEGNPSGISVDLAKALGEYLGREVEIVNIAWDGLIPSLKTGKIDLIISSMTITEERKKTIDFSIPYSKSYLSLLVNKNSPVEKFEDLNAEGRKLAVKKGTTGHVYAKEHLPKTELLVFDKENACVMEVVQGKADAFIYDQMTIYKNWKNNEETTKALLQPFQKDFEYWGVALQKGNDKLKAKVNEFIKQYKKDGGFDKLSYKYLEEQRKTFDEMGIPFFF